MTDFVSSPLFGVGLTLSIYVLAQILYARTRSVLFNPVAVTITVIVVTLLSLDISYADYRQGGEMILFLLGPAVVAIGLPLYQKRSDVRLMAKPIMVGIVVGGLGSIVVASGLVALLGGSREVVLSFMPKSVTAPIAMGVADKIGGVAPLTAAVVVLTGCLGAMCGPEFCRIVGVSDPRAVGLAVGTASHGIGTARMLEIDRLGGTVAGLAIGLNGLFTAVTIPIILACIGV